VAEDGRLDETGRWPFAALTYFGEDPVHRVAYLTLFPLPSGCRANLFVYRELNDPWLKRLRDNPGATIATSLPQLERLTGTLNVKGLLKIRPVDLVATDGVLQPGIALVGDAFSTACPVSVPEKALPDGEASIVAHEPPLNLASIAVGVPE
jgi:2-polyprenyl-6-methoxyphenol hydroxylase-like FAD-dependent oxidoreductase